MKFTFEAIGTSWTIDVYQTQTNLPRSEILTEVLGCIEEFDLLYSRFRPDSMITRIFNKPGSYTLPDSAQVLMNLYEKLFHLTNGAFTPLIGNTLDEAGYDANYSLIPKHMHKPFAWNEALSYQFPLLKVKEKVLLDFGAAGKGYLIDIVGEKMKQLGITDFCIDAGGDILCKSRVKKMKIGLENPSNTTQVIGVAEVSNQSICGSAGNRRTWGEFHHIINPHTLSSPRHIAAVWVIADSTILADALSTALFFVPPNQLEQHFLFEYLLLYPDNTIQKSSRFNGELFINQYDTKN